MWTEAPVAVLRRAWPTPWDGLGLEGKPLHLETELLNYILDAITINNVSMILRDRKIERRLY